MTAHIAFAAPVDTDDDEESYARSGAETRGSVAPAIAPRPRTRELAMSAAWHGGLIRELTTTTGEAIVVVFRGNWSHGFGPDFADAMIQVGDGSMRSGAVEIHLNASDWIHHGHHLDPRYNAVVLHVVARLDTPETRRSDGASVPTVVLDIPETDLFAIDQELPEIWSRIGHSVCAEDVALREPSRMRAAIHRLGDRRFSERVARYEGELSVEPLPAVLRRGLFDAFGYSQNREPMGALIERLLDSGVLGRLASVDREQRLLMSRAPLLGIAGFVPMSPADAQACGLDHVEIAAIEGLWLRESGWLTSLTMPPTRWTRARTRPANHPAARLVSMANLLAATLGDPVSEVLGSIRDGADLPHRLRRLTQAGDHAGLGAGRSIAIAASVVLPVAMAHAHHADDSELEDAVSRAWAELPRSEWSRPATRALAQAVGEAPLGPLGERAIQGLLHLDRTLCTTRRCYECPIAAEVVRDRQRRRREAPGTVQSMLPT